MLSFGFGLGNDSCHVLEKHYMRRGVAAIGLCSWDRFLVLDRYAEPGGYATVQQQFEQAGGTTANTCAALAKLDVEVSFASAVGDDPEGELLIESLVEVGCDPVFVVRTPNTPTDSSYILLQGDASTRDRTILWIKGANPRMGDKLPMEHLLDHRWLLVDVTDDRLREFILELPAHLSPRTQLIGVMTFLTDTGRATAWNHLLRHDIMFGNRAELLHLTGEPDLESAIARAQQDMPGQACRVIYVTLGAEGAVAIRPSEVTSSPAFNLDIVDTTGAGDAFAAGAIWGITEGLPDAEILMRGNAVGGLCCSALGARAGLPTRTEALELIQSGLLYQHEPSP